MGLKIARAYGARSAHVMQAVCGTQQVPYQGQTLDLGQPFRRATMHELVQEALGESSCQAKLGFAYFPQNNSSCVMIMG